MKKFLKSSSEIAVTLNCGSAQGLYVNIKYLNIFLEYYCPEFKKRQSSNIIIENIGMRLYISSRINNVSQFNTQS